MNKLFQKAVAEINLKFFGVESKGSIPDFNEHNLRLLEQIFSTAVFQAPLVRDLDLMARFFSTYLKIFFKLLKNYIFFASFLNKMETVYRYMCETSKEFKLYLPFLNIHTKRQIIFGQFVNLPKIILILVG